MLWKILQVIKKYDQIECKKMNKNKDSYTEAFSTHKEKTADLIPAETVKFACSPHVQLFLRNFLP